MSNDRASFDWTPERCEQLRTLWADNGLSAAKIGVALGGVSRNSVIGKANRMGLPRRTPDGWTAETVAKAFRPKPHRRSALPIAEIAPPAAPEPVPAGGVRMVDLEFWHCRWPLWPIDGPVDGFLHCGQPKSGGAYCEKHARHAHSASTRSERRAA